MSTVFILFVLVHLLKKSPQRLYPHFKISQLMPKVTLFLIEVFYIPDHVNVCRQ
jgi:hypothetical protein